MYAYLRVVCVHVSLVVLDLHQHVHHFLGVLHELNKQTFYLNGTKNNNNNDTVTVGKILGLLKTCRGHLSCGLHS